jgi:osmoprotectant transport system substrate-binding protein
MDLGLAYNALANGDLDIVSAQATDGQIAAMDLTLLKDDKGSSRITRSPRWCGKKRSTPIPELRDILESLSAKLDDAVMQRLNSQVMSRRSRSNRSPPTS